MTNSYNNPDPGWFTNHFFQYTFYCISDSLGYICSLAFWSKRLFPTLNGNVWFFLIVGLIATVAGSHLLMSSSKGFSHEVTFGERLFILGLVWSGMSIVILISPYLC